MIRDLLRRQQALFDGLEGPPEPFVERDAEGAKLLRGRTDTDRQVDTPARDVVEDRDVLGDPDRVMQRQKQHIGADAHPLGARRHRRQKGDRRRVPRVLREVVFARPHIIEAELFGEHRLLQMVPVEVLQRLRLARQPADPHRHNELHAGLRRSAGFIRRPCSIVPRASRPRAMTERRLCRSGLTRRRSRKCPAPRCRGSGSRGSVRSCRPPSCRRSSP